VCKARTWDAPAVAEPSSVFTLGDFASTQLSIRRTIRVDRQLATGELLRMGSLVTPGTDHAV